MENTDKGDRIRIDIPDETDPDHQYHGEHGVVVKVLSDDAGEVTGDSRESRLYRIQLESGETIDVRWRDIRPPIQ
jgi:ribosomal protein L21E